MAVNRVIYSWQEFSSSLCDCPRCLYVNDVQGRGLGHHTKSAFDQVRRAGGLDGLNLLKSLFSVKWIRL
jgi:hypothetical protein